MCRVSFLCVCVGSCLSCINTVAVLLLRCEQNRVHDCRWNLSARPLPALNQPYSFFARVGRMMPLRLRHLISSNHRIQTFLTHHMWRLGLPLVTFIWIYVVVTIEVTISSNPVIHKSPRFAASFGQVRARFPFIQCLRCESAFRFFPSSQLESPLCQSITIRGLGCDVRPSEGV